MKTLSSQMIHLIMTIFFVISSALGLICEIACFRYLSLSLGNTTYAQIIILAILMGGLAIGSAWWGRKIDQVKHQLRLFAFLEIGIGFYCLMCSKFLELLKNIFISIVVSSQLPSNGITGLLLKIVVSICFLFIPYYYNRWNSAYTCSINISQI